MAALEPGEVSAPVKTQFGWHVIYLADKQVTPFEDAKAGLLEPLADQEFRGWLEERADELGRRGEPALRPVLRRDVLGAARTKHGSERRRRPGRRRHFAGAVTADLPDPSPHIPDGPVPVVEEGRRLLDLVKVMARLRGPDGCPWDREQTHETLARHLLEESHELLDAIDRGDSDATRDELGDLLLQVVFHAQMAAEDGRWDVDDVARGLVAKLVHRHPHVFGDVEVSGSDEVLTNWERLKAEEGSAPRAAVDAEIPPRCRRSPARPRCNGGPRAGASSGRTRTRRWRRSERRPRISPAQRMTTRRP